MIYFKTAQIDLLESAVIENRIRKASIKSVGHLDLTSSTSYIGTEKKFFGHETEKCLMITRIRGPIEKYLPKLIVKFDKQEGYNKYKIRFSLIATILITLLTLLAISLFIESIKSQQFESQLIMALVIIVTLILMTIIEMKVTQKIITKILFDRN